MKVELKNKKLRNLRVLVRGFRKMLKQQYPKEFQGDAEYTRLENQLDMFINYGSWEFDND